MERCSNQINVFPAQPKNLALPRSKAERDTEERLQPISLHSREKLLGLLVSKRLRLESHFARNVDQSGDVAHHIAVAKRLVQRAAERCADIADRVVRQPIVGQAIEHLLHVVGRKPRELQMAQRRNDVMIDVVSVLGICSRANPSPDSLLQPVLQKLLDSLLLWRQVDASNLVAVERLEFRGDLLPRFAIDDLAHALTVDKAKVNRGAPLAVALSLIDRPFPIPSAFAAHSNLLQRDFTC